MTKEKKINKILFFAIPFVFLNIWLVYDILTDNIQTAMGYYLFHFVYNYTHGYMARGLCGQILYLLFDKLSETIIDNVIIFGSELLVIAASVCIAVALSKTSVSRNSFIATAILATILVLSRNSFREYMTDMKFDKIIWALTLFSVLLACNKFSIWFTPITCLICAMINPVFMFTSMIIIAIVLLQKFYDNNYSKANLIICLAAYLSMIAIVLYGTLNETKLGFENVEEFCDYYLQRLEDYTGNPYEYASERSMAEWFFDYFPTGNFILKDSFNNYFIEWELWKKCLFSSVFFALPWYTVLGRFWVRVIKHTDNSFQKFIFFLCLISPVVILPAIILSWEASKYYSANIISQLILIIYYLVSKNSAVVDAINDTFTKIKQNPVCAFVICSYFSILTAA